MHNSKLRVKSASRLTTWRLWELRLYRQYFIAHVVGVLTPLPQGVELLPDVRVSSLPKLLVVLLNP